MKTEKIEIPTWELLESLGVPTVELVDIDLKGDVVVLTVVEAGEGEQMQHGQLVIAEEKGLKDVQVFQICECDAVAAYTVEEAKAWYKELTGVTDDELYPNEEIEIVPHVTKVYESEDSAKLITVREIIETYFNGEPFIALSTEG